MTIDRDKAAAVGLNATTITQALSDGFGQILVGTIYGARTQYRVVLELDPKYQERPESLKRISFRTPQGALVPLEEVMNIKEDVGPQSVNHYGQLPAVNISFGLRPGVSLGAAIDHVNQIARQVLPATVTISLQGSAKVFQASLSNLSLLFFIAVGVVYIVLGMLYESYIHPITILSTLPSAGVGAILALLLTGNDLGVVGLIGIILLIGIVKKNAIMMIDFALEAERVEHKPPEEAIFQACLLRFRPIMMTTMAALLGGLPLALGSGTGSELRHPLGITIVGGLLLSQLLTLYTTPVVYLFFDRLAQKFERFQIGNPIEEPAAGD
jgi:multidrug efflux pump